MTTRLDKVRAAFRKRGTTSFLVAAVVLGGLVGLGTAVLAILVDIVETWTDSFGDWTNWGLWAFAVTIPIGMSVSWWLNERLGPGISGGGVSETMVGMSLHGGYLPTRSIFPKVAATAATLGTGGSGGAEGPVAYIGAAIGSTLSRYTRFDHDRIRSLVAAGAGAGIGASFNAPIAGMLFAMEVILGTFSVRHLSSVVIASVTAAVTFRSLPLPEEALLTAGSYRLGDFRELLLYAGLAVLAVIVAVVFLKLVDLVEHRAPRLPGPAWMRPVLLGLLVGVIGVVEPAVLGTGQEFVSELLTNQVFEQIGLPPTAWYVLLGLAGAKIVATAFTISSGGSGGAFMPSLFIGAALGAGYGQLVQEVWGFSNVQPGAFAVVGMATVFAAVARAPLTAILIVFEVTGARDYGLVLPLMLSATFATFIADRIHPESIYSLPLARRGIKAIRTGEFDLLDTVSVQEVMSPVVTAADPRATVADTQRLLDRHRNHGLPVIDHGRLVGIITVSDINRAGGPGSDALVEQAMTPKPVTVGPSTPVSAALQRMAVLGVGRLPVVADEDATRLLGLFRREDAVRAYHRALGSSTSHELFRQRLRQRTAPGATYFDFRVPPGSIADGKMVRDVSWPEGCTLVSVQRGIDVMVPAGNTVLSSGDIVTAFGTPGSRQRVIERLNAGADEPTAEIVMPPDDDGQSSEVQA